MKPQWKNIEVSQKLKIELLHDPATPFPGLSSKRMKTLAGRTPSPPGHGGTVRSVPIDGWVSKETGIALAEYHPSI